MNCKPKYYIYRHVRLDNNEIFYIGQGSKRQRVNDYSKETSIYERAYSKRIRNYLWKSIVDITDYIVEIMFESDDYDFIIKKVIDMTKIDVIASNHLSTYQHTLTPSDFVIVKDISTDEDSNVSFKKQIKADLTKFPSEQVYLEYRNRYVLQHNNSMLTNQNLLIEEDTYTDTIQSFNTPSTIYDDYKFVKIGNTYYYKNSDPYYSVFLFEEDSPFLLEDALNFILEF